MASESKRNDTYPHDYRLICTGKETPVVVGGQAVSLWAISYLEGNDPDLRSEEYGSKDLDILAEKKVIDYLKTVPGWTFATTNPRNWTDSRKGFLRGMSEDGRKLLVEVLHTVYGLESNDLTHVETVRYAGLEYRVLDPIVMLKAKAANVRDIKQDGDPPRHDREHLRLIARCMPIYLQRMHQAGIDNPGIEKEVLAIVSRAFKTLQNSKTALTLQREGIVPASLIPPEFAESPLPRVRTAYEWQHKTLLGATTALKSSETGELETPRSTESPRNRPRI